MSGREPEQFVFAGTSRRNYQAFQPTLPGPIITIATIISSITVLTVTTSIMSNTKLATIAITTIKYYYKSKNRVCQSPKQEVSRSVRELAEISIAVWCVVPP